MNFELLQDPSFGVLPYAILGLLTMVEGPLATLMGGAVATSGYLLPIPAFFSIVLGNLTADMGWYFLGRASKMEWLAHFSSKIGLGTERFNQLKQMVNLHAARLLFLAKLTVGLPIPTIVATGLSRVPIRRWIAPLVAGELVKSAVLVSVGYIFALSIQQATLGVQITLWVITIIVVIGAVIWYKRHHHSIHS